MMLSNLCHSSDSLWCHASRVTPACRGNLARLESGLNLRNDAQLLVRHRIDDVVDPQTVGRGRILLRVVGNVGPFPGIAQIRVEIDHHYETTGLIEDPPEVGVVAILFIGYATVEHLGSWHLYEGLDVKETVKHGMRDGNLFNLTRRKDLANLSFEILPFIGSMKVVHNEKSTALEVLAKNIGLFLRELHVAYLDRI